MKNTYDASEELAMGITNITAGPDASEGELEPYPGKDQLDKWKERYLASLEAEEYEEEEEDTPAHGLIVLVQHGQCEAAAFLRTFSQVVDFCDKLYEGEQTDTLTISAYSAGCEGLRSHTLIHRWTIDLEYLSAQIGEVEHQLKIMIQDILPVAGGSYY